MSANNTNLMSKEQFPLAVTPKAMEVLRGQLSSRRNDGLTASYKGLASEAIVNYYNPPQGGVQ